MRLAPPKVASGPPANALTRADLYADPRKPARVGLVVIGAFVLCLTLWGALAPVSGAAIAEGSLQVEAQRQSVQHPYGGVVKTLLVHEGQRVKEGEVLMTLSDTEPRAKLDVLLAEQITLTAQEGRLVAERDGAEEPQFAETLLARKDDPLVAQTLANERAIMAARARQFDAETGMLRRKVGQLREKIEGMRAQVEGLRRQHDLFGEELAGARELLEKGYTPKTRVLALERQMAELEADRGAKVAEIAAAEQAIGEAELALAKAERARIAEITDQLRQTQSRLAELRPRVEAAQDVLDRTRIAAPMSGEVVSLAVFTEGGVVQQGARLLDVVPTGNPLIVEARLPLADVNQIKPGQSADIRLTGIPRNERPRMRGTVMTVSADRVTDEKSGHGYYAVRIRPNAEDLADNTFDLQSGMPVEVIMTTRPRTFAGYLFSPLLDEISGAFRER